MGICRGAQTLNVARGGTLHQHLPDVVGDTIAHRQIEDGRLPTHPVAVAPGSALAAVLGTTQLNVNSFHHQAVDRLGAGLAACAWAPDGTIEAVEDPEQPSSLLFSGTRRLCATFLCIRRCSMSWPTSQLEAPRCDALLSAGVFGTS